MTNAIIECVPNFSEGRDERIIQEIVNAISQAPEGTPTVKILHTDSGYDANRTVVTFAGSPEAVYSAALRMAKAAFELINMKVQHGVHPRLGSLDVLPLVPVNGITLGECAEMADRLAAEIYDTLGIPCYLYEAASPRRWKLERCRKGEYEGLPARLGTDDGPEYGPSQWNDVVARSGAFNVGARKYLGAVNFNLPPETPLEIAKKIAGRVRTSGSKGLPGSLQCCKAIGWYMEEYGFCQVSTNLTDMEITPLRMAYDEICRLASALGTTVTGIEIIGLLPRFAVKGMEDFVPDNKILENLL